MKRQQRFSLRKFKFGLASALLGTALIFGSGQANADEQTAINTSEASQQSSLVTTADPSEQESLSADNATVKEDKSQASEEVDKSSSSEPANAQAPSAGETKEEKQVASETAVAIDPKQTVSTAEGTSPSSAKKDDKQEVRATNPESKPATTEAVASENTGQPVATATSAEETKASKDEQPTSISSNEIIKVPQTWSQGYKGEGRLVAVIDSGLDVHHEVLRISDPSKAKYQSEAALEEAKKKAGIDYGKWYNSKVVYAYNYIDGDDSIKEKDSYSHGMHVTGITAGNPDKKDSNGEYIYGVAPEAQVMFMRVFSDRQKTTSGISDTCRILRTPTHTEGRTTTGKVDIPIS